ncbi:MAG: hypothetical protein WAU47_13140 [Desulfobaccales bacterium]
MDTTILTFLREYWWLWVIQGVAVLWGLSLLLVRHWTMKRVRAAADQTEEKLDEDLEIPLPDPTPQDQEALALLREYRRRYLLKLWPDTKFTLREINNLSQALVTEIARVYYPEEERPELKASLADLVALYQRVGARLSMWLEAKPFIPLRDMELNTVLLIHKTYRKFRDNPVHQFLKRHQMYRAARWLWMAINVANPYYWGREAAYRGSREFLVRLFLAKVVTVVGEEAIRLYGRRSPNTPLVRLYQVGVQEMLNLALKENGALSTEVLAHLMKAILKARGLEDREKVALFKKLSRPKKRESGLAGLGPPGQQEVQEWLACQVKSCWQGTERQEILARVQERWQEAKGSPEPEKLLE